MPNRNVTLRGMYLARKRIASLIRRTPLEASLPLSEALGTRVVLKLENLQATGSFKIRGAANKVLSLSDQERAAGIITVSSGNHGRAVSTVAQSLGVPAVVCISEAVPANKLQAIEKLGAEVQIGGATYDHAAALAARLETERGLSMVHPFDDPFVIEGQGTIGLELLEDYPEIDTVLVPLSGGGLLSGVAFALKAADPSIRTVGVSMDRGPAMIKSLRAGTIVEVHEDPTLADALAGGLGPNNAYTFDLIQELVDNTVLVTEQEIAQAMTFAFEEHRVVVEGGGAVGVAALLSGKAKPLGRNVAVVISGGNVELPLLLDVVQGRTPGREQQGQAL